MATMESAAHEVTFNVISHGRPERALPKYQRAAPPLRGAAKHPRKPLRPRIPHQRLLRVKGRAQVH